MRLCKARSGWEPISDGAALIGLAGSDTGAAISLEPGGQFELSGAPLASVHEVADEFDAHLAAVHAAAEPLGIDFLSLGMQPKWPRTAHSLHAEAALRHHGRLHAEGRARSAST